MDTSFSARNLENLKMKMDFFRVNANTIFLSVRILNTVLFLIIWWLCVLHEMTIIKNVDLSMCVVL